jgi:hypothetical protein
MCVSLTSAKTQPETSYPRVDDPLRFLAPIGYRCDRAFRLARSAWARPWGMGPAFSIISIRNSICASAVLDRRSGARREARRARDRKRSLQERCHAPRNDATDVSEALKRLGFETIVGLDLDKTGMEDATIKLARAAARDALARVYYSCDSA